MYFVFIAKECVTKIRVSVYMDMYGDRAMNPVHVPNWLTAGTGSGFRAWLFTSSAVVVSLGNGLDMGIPIATLSTAPIYFFLAGAALQGHQAPSGI
jgi:hypothetical protein